MSARAADGPPLRVLENASLRVAIAPSAGGKIVSLRSRATGTEWLLPPLRPWSEARSDAGFDQWDGGGFDECLPTVASSGDAPDHGELWRHPWQEEPSEDGIRLRTTAMGGALSVLRTARLEGSALVLDYRLFNQGAGPLALLYSAHPLLGVRRGDRILLPAGVRELAVEGSLPGGLGPRGTRVPWPLAAPGVDLSQVGPPDGLQADKLFAGPMAEGRCALTRPAGGEGIALEFEASVLPWLGLWICRAAWPASGAARQYAVAFEPASAPTDSLAEAVRSGAAWQLDAGESRAWTLRFRVGSLPEIEAAMNPDRPVEAGRRENRSPGRTGPKGTSPNNASPKSTSPKSTSQKNTSQENMSQENMSPENTDRENTDQETAP